MTAAGTSVAARGTGRRARLLVPALVSITLVLAVIGSLGAPLITAIAQSYGISLAAAQWSLTITLLSGAVATPLLGRLGSDHRRRKVVLATLAIVVAGSIAVVLPAPYAVLLIGRAAHGAGLGLTPLMMATARQHLGERAPSTIAVLSVTSMAGIGVGYPLAGLLAQIGGVGLPFLLALAGTVTALIIAVVVLPRDPRDAPKAPPTDWAGAVLLSLGLVAVLLVASDSGLWGSHPAVAGVILAAGLVTLTGWVAAELRVRYPLVDLRALRHPAVARANVIMAVSVTAMYLLFTLISRYVQTPAQAGYGYGMTDFEAGLMLLPYSALGFATGRGVPALQRRLGPFASLAASGAVLAAACAVFATTRTLAVAWPVVAMGLLGMASGGISASMPAAILTVTPREETAAAMSVNQTIRAMALTLGSALSGLVLAAYTPEGQFAPADSGYTTAACAGAVLGLVTVALAATRGARAHGSR